MEALGGYYGVTDRLDGKRGSLFWFAFPYRPDFDAEEAMKLAEVAEVAAEIIHGNNPLAAPSMLPSATVGVAATATSGTSSVQQRQSAVSRLPSGRMSHKPISLRGLQIAESHMSSELRVLVVDDSLTILKMISRTLEQHGFTVETAKNGSIGLNKLIESNLKPYAATGSGGDDSKDQQCDLSKRFDIVLMDLQMPVMGK
jgi:hypothetical protein